MIFIRNDTRTHSQKEWPDADLAFKSLFNELDENKNEPIVYPKSITTLY